MIKVKTVHWQVGWGEFFNLVSHLILVLLRIIILGRYLTNQLGMSRNKRQQLSGPLNKLLPSRERATKSIIRQDVFRREVMKRARILTFSLVRFQKQLKTAAINTLQPSCAQCYLNLFGRPYFCNALCRVLCSK